MTLFCPKEQSEAQKSKYYSDFVAAFNDLVDLKRKLKQIIDDICDIILECGFHVMRYYLESAVKRVIFFVDKCDLHYKGICMRRHQKITEENYLICEKLCKNVKGSFESDDVRSEAESTPRLTARSYLAMYYFKVVSKSKTSIREIDVHEKGREIDQMKISAYKFFETDIFNALHKRTNVKKAGLTTTLRDIPEIKIRITKEAVANTREANPSIEADQISENIWVTNMFSKADFDIFKSDNSKMHDNILQLKLNCPRDAAGNILFDHRKLLAREGEAPPAKQSGAASNIKVVRSGQAKSITNQQPANVDALNAASGVGKRKFVAVPEATQNSTSDKSAQSDSPVMADRYVTANDHTPHEDDTPSSQEVVVRGGSKRRKRNQYNVQAANALSTDKQWWDQQSEQEAVTDKDIAPAFKKLSKDRNRRKIDKYATVNQQTPGRSADVSTPQARKNSQLSGTCII